MQFFGKYPTGTWFRARVTPSQTGAIIGAHASELRHLWLYFVPGQPGIRQSRVQDDRRRAHSDAVDVHPVPADVHQTARSVISASIDMRRDGLISSADASDKKYEADDSAKRSSQIPNGRAPEAQTSHYFSPSLHEPDCIDFLQLGIQKSSEAEQASGFDRNAAPKNDCFSDTDVSIQPAIKVGKTASELVAKTVSRKRHAEDDETCAGPYTVFCPVVPQDPYKALVFGFFT